MRSGNYFDGYNCLVLPLIVVFFISWRIGNPGSKITETYQVPVLSYHNVQANPNKPSAYYISSAVFEKQIKYLKDNGYKTILPDDIYNYYISCTTLPEKPIMLSFDDTRKEHFNIVAPILEKYGFKGTFFIMTVAIGKKNYMTASDIKMLSDNGHCIGHHTYDHQDLRKLPIKEWNTQIDKPKIKLEKIIRKEVNYLAYPFGLCNDYAAKELKKRNFKGAFQLSGRQDKNNPLLTIRRLIVPGNWDGKRLIKEISVSFK